ncbi:MAG: OB-fold domain-containing protein [Chloroflexi bacterium]|nr:OB-fold domain-containing protein [Chloroflexota bacterium]
MPESTAVQGQVPALEGWFTWPPSAEPALLGSRCKACGDYFFPPTTYCRNPRCMGADVETVPLSRRGKLWTYTINYYQPPLPYVAPTPFVPYATAAIELDKEKMKVQGMVASGVNVESLKIGMEMELVLEVLYRDGEGRQVMVWKFRPV